MKQIPIIISTRYNAGERVTFLQINDRNGESVANALTLTCGHTTMNANSINGVLVVDGKAGSYTDRSY